MVKCDHGAVPPTTLKHVGKVLAARTQNAAMCRKHVAMNNERDVTVHTAIQQSERKDTYTLQKSTYIYVLWK